MVELRAFLLPDGTSPFGDWFDSLHAAPAARVKAALDRMQLGNLGDWKGVGEGVCERRIHFEKGYRVYFGRDGDTLVILLGGGTKQRQNQDIRAAQRLWKDYKQRKKGER